MVVVVVVVVVDVVVVGDGSVVVVGTGGGVVVVVGAEAGAGGPGGGGGGIGKLHMAAAHSVGVVAMTTYTPGRVVNDHTGRGGPPERHDRAGSEVPMPPRKPISCDLPPVGGGSIGLRATSGTPAKVAKVRNPLPGGGPFSVSLATGALPNSAVNRVELVPSMPSAQIPTPAMWK